MSTTDLLRLSATAAAALIRRRQLSPVEYVEAVLAAVQATQGTLNAFATVTAEQAHGAARVAEQAVMDGRPLGPLHGVPINIKDLFATAGVRTGYGSVIHAGNVPEADDVLVTRVRQAGAIMIGKSTTPEFGHKGLTDSPAHGITRNPWNLERTSGGSSGGAAAAVAAGLGPLGLGTDGAGSIRIPAAACGIVGLKPTTGAVPYEQAVDSFNNYAAAGPLTRTIGDAALLMDVLVGAASIDPWSLGAPPLGRVRPRLTSDDLAGLRIGVIERMSNATLADDVSANTRAALCDLATAGAEVEDVADPIDWIPEAARIMYFGNIHVSFGGYVEKWRARMDPVLLDYIARGATFGLADYRRAQMARSRLFRAIQRLFERYDFLATPTLTTTAPTADPDAHADSASIMQGWNAYLYPFNQTGHPALSVPSGVGADGLPTGIQLVGPWWADADVLRLGSVLERARPWADHWPPVRV